MWVLEDYVEQVKCRNQEALAAGEIWGVMTQRTARTMVHGEVEGRRSHGGDLADKNRGMTDGDETNGDGDPGRVNEPIRH